MVRSGVEPGVLQSLKDVVVPERVAAALTFIHGRAGGVWGLHTGQLAGLAGSIARHYAGADPDQLRRLVRLQRKVMPTIEGMTERNRERLRALDDPARLHALVSLPVRLWEEVRRGGKPSIMLARLLRGAVAIEILLMTPIRLKNLRSLELGRNVLVDSRGTMTVALPPGETKNRQPFEGPLPSSSSRMIVAYLQSFQPLLCGKRSACLFPSTAGDGPMSEDGLRSHIETLALERAGLVLNPHLFRHIAGKLILDSNPGAYGRVRLTLGHRSVRTTELFYAGAETRAAVALYGREVLQLRRELGMGEDDELPRSGSNERRRNGGRR
jgi:integrase